MFSRETSETYLRLRNPIAAIRQFGVDVLAESIEKNDARVCDVVFAMCIDIGGQTLRPSLLALHHVRNRPRDGGSERCFGFTDVCKNIHSNECLPGKYCILENWINEIDFLTEIVFHMIDFRLLLSDQVLQFLQIVQLSEHRLFLDVLRRDFCLFLSDSILDASKFILQLFNTARNSVFP